MTSAASVAAPDTTDWRVVVAAGAKVGAVTAIGVAAFALISRVVSGTPEIVIQGILVLTGGAVFAYLPSRFLNPRDVDSIAWTAMIGLLGALVFTVIDTAFFRPIDLYHWTWDAIGGGSGFWYVPVWWMGAATLAWLGAWTLANHRRRGRPTLLAVALQSVGFGMVGAGILIGAGIVPFHAAGIALGFVLGLVAHVAVSGVRARG